MGSERGDEARAVAGVQLHGHPGWSNGELSLTHIARQGQGCACTSNWYARWRSIEMAPGRSETPRVCNFGSMVDAAPGPNI